MYEQITQTNVPVLLNYKDTKMAEFTTVKNRIQFFDGLSSKDRSKSMGNVYQRSKSVLSNEESTIVTNIESELKVIEYQIHEYNLYEKELHQVLQLKLFDILIKLVRFNDKSRKIWKQEIGGKIQDLFKILNQRLPMKNVQGNVVMQKRAIFEHVDIQEVKTKLENQLRNSSVTPENQESIDNITTKLDKVDNTNLKEIKPKLFIKNRQKSPSDSHVIPTKENVFTWSVSQLKNKFEGTNEDKDIPLTETNLMNWRAKHTLTGKYLTRGGIFNRYNVKRSKSESCLAEEQEFD